MSEFVTALYFVTAAIFLIFILVLGWKPIVGVFLGGIGAAIAASIVTVLIMFLLALTAEGGSTIPGIGFLLWLLLTTVFALPFTAWTLGKLEYRLNHTWWDTLWGHPGTLEKSEGESPTANHDNESATSDQVSNDPRRRHKYGTTKSDDTDKSEDVKVVITEDGFETRPVDDEK